MSSRPDELDAVAHAADQLERVFGERSWSSAGSDASVATDFAAALSTWAASQPGLHHARRALLLWYAKALASTRGDATQRDELLHALHARLTPAERLTVQDAIERGWSNVERGNTIRVMAARHRKDFERSLSGADRRRYWWFLGGARPVDAASPPAASSEPTDDELISLAVEAFAGVDEGNRRARAAVETRVAERRVEVLARLAARHRSRDANRA